MSSTTKPTDACQIRALSPTELDAIAGGAATKPTVPFPGPCFPRPPKLPSSIM